MRIIPVGRFKGHLPLPPHQVLLLEISVGFLDRLHTSHAHPFHQPILCRPEIPFHPSFRLRRMRRKPHDPQFLQRATDLCGWHFYRVLVHSRFIPPAVFRRLEQSCFICVELHPSPGATLPSSHCSPPATIP